MFSTIGYYICIPFAALLRIFYNMTGSYGLSLIFFTLVIKLIMLPFQMKSKKSMMRMSRMSGRLQEIQKKYANNQAKQSEEMQKLYAEEGINPMSGCLWSLLPFPILLALYSIIRQPITHFMMLSQDVVQQMVDAVTGAGLDVSGIVQMKDGAAIVRDGITQLLPYGQINLVKAIASQMPELGESVPGWINMNYTSFGLDMAANPWSMVTNFAFTWAAIGLILIPILAGGSQWLMTKITMKHQPQTDPSAASANRMMMFMPLFSVYIAFTMPAALGVYWIAQSAFAAVQEFLMGNFFNKKLEEEENARYEARQAERKRKMEEAKVLQEQQKQEAARKKSLKEKRQEAQEAKTRAKKPSTTEAGRVGERPYARGRSYKADRYDTED